MLWILVALAAAVPPSFVFEGQPDCVLLSYAEGRTVLENRCAAPVWVDQSVRTPGGPLGPVAVDETAVLRDLSAFTLGVDGALYRAVARVVPAEVEAEAKGPVAMK